MTSFNIRNSLILPVLATLLFFPDHRTVIGIIAVLIHELGHIITIILLGYRIKGISLQAGGLEIQTDMLPAGRRHKIIIAISGCTANAFSALMSFIISPDIPPWDIYFEYFFFCSLIIAIFNILPINGLDGGEILEQILDMFFMPDTVYTIYRSISLLFTFLLWVSACYILMVSNSNISLLLVCMSLFLLNIKY